MKIELIYMILSLFALVFGLVTLALVSRLRNYDRHYNKDGVTAYMVALIVVSVIALLYTIIYGAEVFPSIGSAPNISLLTQTFGEAINYTLYFLVAVVFLISAYLLRKR